MNVAMEAVLQPLYKVEVQSYIDDLAEDESEELRASHTEIIVDLLANIKDSCLVGELQFKTSPIRTGGRPMEKGKGKSKDQPKGGKSEHFPAVGGKAQGKSAYPQPSFRMLYPFLVESL